MRLFTGLWFVSTFVAAQSDPDFFLFPPAVPLNAEFSSDSTPVSLEFAIGSTQTLKWETKLPTYQIIGRMVLSEDGAEDLTVYAKNTSDPERGTYEWTVPEPNSNLPYWFYLSVSGSLKCKSMPFNISEASLMPPPDHTGASAPTRTSVAGIGPSAFTAASSSNGTTDSGNVEVDGSGANKTGPLALGLGLGVGVPVLLLIIGGIYWANRYSKKHPPPPPAANQQEIKYPVMPEMAGSEYHPELYGRQVGMQRSELPVKRDMRIELPANRETLEMAVR